jgi:hypothetical protein
MQKRLLIALFGVLTQGAASAEIYKVLGPDGKIIYSNVAPKDKNTPVAILNSPPGQRPAIHSAAMPAVQAAPRMRSGSETLSPDVVGAVANVMGMAHLVSSTRDFCVAALPASLKRYSAAVLGWQQRNEAVMAKKDRVLSTSDRHLIAAALGGDMLRMTDDMMRPVRQAVAAERIKWCDKTIADIDHGVLDLVGRASISPLMSYSLR